MGITGWFRGYLVLFISGQHPERFVNLCTLRGIYIKDASRKDGGIYIKVSLRAFREMIIPAKRAKCRVKIVKKAGFPFVFSRLKKRRILILGAAFFVVITAILNSFIWTVRIDGNKNITEDEIKFIASYCGLRQGVVKYKVDEKKFSQNALKCDRRLSWIWPEIKGTVCYIHVREKDLSLPPIDTKVAGDVYAKRSGIINSVTVKRGWPCVKKGDSVKEGQVLISSQKEGFSPVHALGEVVASYWIEKEETAKTKKEIITYTGREKSRYSMIIGSFGMSFSFSGKAPFESFIKKREEENLKLFGEILLPVKIRKIKYYETVPETVEIPMELAVNETKEKIIRDFESGLDDGTVIKNITVSTALINENEACVKVIFECSEDIALFRQ